ncbi:unnamed protein product, partial [Cladocopium goreaui]
MGGENEAIVKRNKPRMSRRSTDGGITGSFYLPVEEAGKIGAENARQGSISLAMRKDSKTRSSSKSAIAVDATLSNRSGSNSRTSSHSTGRTGSKTKITLPFEEFRLRRRSSGVAALAEFLTSGHHGLASPEADSSKPLGKTLQRRATMPTLDVSSEALVLSRQLHLDFHEVKSAMKEIREGRHLPNGGMDEVAWRHCLSRIFGIDVEEKLLRESYAACQVAEGPVDAKLFMTWYRSHIFKIEAHKTKSLEGDELTMELAKKHGCSYTDLTKVRLKFDSYDLDKSGLIDFLEFEHMIHQLLHCSTRSDLPKNRILRFWHEIDRDQNGSVDFQEFTDWYMKYFATAKQDGPIEAFYASFMPDFQRSHTLEASVAYGRLYKRLSQLTEGWRRIFPFFLPTE